MATERQAVTSLEDLERRVREHGVRVEERLALLRILAEADAEPKLRALHEERLATVRATSNRLKEIAG